MNCIFTELIDQIKNPVMIGNFARVQCCAVLFISVLISSQYELCAQEETEQNLAQYLFPAFSKGTVGTRAGKTLTLSLNYNTVSGRMVYEQKGQYYDLTNPETTDTVIIQNRKFIPQKDVFLEVVLNDSISFYIQHLGKLVEPGKPGGYGQTSQISSSTYLTGMQGSSGYYNLKLPEGTDVRPEPLYWVKVGGKMKSFPGEKQFLKLFPDKAEILKKYIKENKLKLDRTDDLVKLGAFCNGLK